MLKVITLKLPKNRQDREKTIVSHNWGSEQSKLIVKSYWYQFWPNLVAFRADTDVSDIAIMARGMKRPKMPLKLSKIRQVRNNTIVLQ